ncbi:hypothetical protein OSTOST_18969 [Ostertagia ostertagi]
MSRKWIAFLVIALILHSVCAYPYPETDREKWEAYKRDKMIVNDSRNLKDMPFFGDGGLRKAHTET